MQIVSRICHKAADGTSRVVCKGQISAIHFAHGGAVKMPYPPRGID
jgi:hypothetical protein